ncbi:MAG TPA: folylpolyglutamate synthase/dihydrofolate synthase family protein, partial [Candidatus Udaeobacter sp.]|nr:folylpolyglutamate synthase/dihydrofolate synthase family protein [Candidatus Udaeobacter sp.]
MSLDLQHTLESLYGLERRKDKLGLEGTRALLGALGHPERSFRAVHVAGTNGKGSTSAVIERVLREAGIRTGLFTSPHLVDFRERIRVNGQWADEARLGERLEHLQSLPEGRDRTFFEVCTALAFDDFAARGVDWGVIEVGLGGRLDCTNVLHPDVCVITSIGLDHTEILGDTLEKIAAEKAGIIKAGVPVVVADHDPRVRSVIDAVAGEQGAPLLASGDRVSVRELEPNRGRRPVARRIEIEAEPWGRFEALSPLLGAHQLENITTALEALAELHRQGLRISAEAVRTGLERVRWPGRLEPCPAEPRLWWDGAHNAAGIAGLCAAWKESLPAPRAIVLALSRDKDVAAIVRALGAFAPDTRLIATRTRIERALDPAEIERLAR